jgi:hypothetical protein
MQQYYWQQQQQQQQPVEQGSRHCLLSCGVTINNSSNCW